MHSCTHPSLEACRSMRQSRVTSETPKVMIANYSRETTLSKTPPGVVSDGGITLSKTPPEL